MQDAIASVLTFDCAGGFPSESRFFDGHFPGDPIVPGAVILGFLAARCEDAGYRMHRIDRVKFSRPLAPETGFSLRIAPARGAWSAEFADAGGPFAHARLALIPENG